MIFRQCEGGIAATPKSRNSLSQCVIRLALDIGDIKLGRIHRPRPIGLFRMPLTESWNVIRAAREIDIYQKGGTLGAGASVRYMSHRSVGGHHVPCPARPQRRRSRRGDHVLFQAVQYRTGQGQRGLRQVRRRRAATETGAVKNPGKGGTINRLGVEVESSERVHDEIARLTGEGLFTDEEIGTTCFRHPGQDLG